MKLKATDKFIKEDKFDKEVQRHRYKNEEFETNEERAKLLIENGYAISLEEKTEKAEEPIEEKTEKKKGKTIVK